jgi:hypothetical protein
MYLCTTNKQHHVVSYIHTYGHMVCLIILLHIMILSINNIEKYIWLCRFVAINAIYNSVIIFNGVSITVDR